MKAKVKILSIPLLAMMVLASLAGFSLVPFVSAGGVSQSVQYSVNSTVSLPVNVSLMYANGTADGTLYGTPTWPAGGGVYFNSTSSQYFNASSTLVQNLTSKTVLIWFKAGTPMAAQDLYYDSEYESPYGDDIHFTDNTTMYIALYNTTSSRSEGGPYTLPAVPTSPTLVGYTWNGTMISPICNTTIGTAIADFTGTLACLNPIFLDGSYMVASGNSTVYGLYIINGGITQFQLNSIYAAGAKSFAYVPNLKLYYGFNESSGTNVYGYDAFANFTAQGSPSTLTISHQTGGVNSTLYFYSPSFPYDNGTRTWAVAAGNNTLWRVNNSAAQVLYLNSYSDSSTDTNYAAIPTDWDLNGYYPGDEAVQYVFLDTSVTHNGDDSIRLDPITYPDRATWINQQLSIKPGDLIDASLWIKLSSAVTGYGGGRFGVDLYNANNQYLDGISYDYGGGLPQSPQPSDVFVQSTNWTLMNISFTVPATVTSDENGNPVTWADKVPALAVMWIQVMMSNDSESGYFADAALYVNPTSAGFYYLTVNAPSHGAVNVSSSWYDTGASVPILATPNSNYAFANMSIDGANSSSNPYTLTMDANHTVTAYFSLIQYYLAVGVANHGTMNTTSGWYTNGTTVPVLDTPSSNYAFSNFTLDSTNSTLNPISVLMTTNHTLTSDNKLIQYYLTVGADVHGSLNVTSGGYSSGAVVPVLDTPAAHYYFSIFTLDGSNSTVNPISITMNQNHTLTCENLIDEYYITIADNSHGSENQSSNWYPYGDSLPILGTASSNYAFANYTLDATNGTDNPYTLTVDANHTITFYYYASGNSGNGNGGPGGGGGGYPPLSAVPNSNNSSASSSLTPIQHIANVWGSLSSVEQRAVMIVIIVAVVFGVGFVAFSALHVGDGKSSYGKKRSHSGKRKK